MSLLMTRGALLSQGEGAGPGPEPSDEVKMDATRVPSGYTLSGDELTVVNTSGGSDYRRWVPAEKLIPTDFDGITYWEVAVQATQTGDLNGYCGVYPAPLIDGSSGYDSGTNPGQADGTIGYRGNGDIWADGSNPTSEPESYGDGDVLMFAFQPSEGAIWVGKNGTWHRDPDTDAPSYSTPNLNEAGWLPIIHGRDGGDGGTLRSVEAQFSYAVPAGAAAYGEELLNLVDDLETASADLFMEMGGEARGTAGRMEEWYEMGGGSSHTTASLELWIEEDVT